MVRSGIQILLILLPLMTRSQGLDSRLGELRAGFGEAVRFSIRGEDELIIAFRDQGGLIRQDVVPLSQVDADALEYSLQDDAVVIRCDAAHARCIRSEQFRSASTRLCNQVRLPRPLDDTGARNLIDSLRALVLACRDRLAETQPVGLRKN